MYATTTRINRNILECKGRCSRQMLVPVLVLIETYWNVKLCTAASLSFSDLVLIETYWNVKYFIISPG